MAPTLDGFILILLTNDIDVSGKRARGFYRLKDHLGSFQGANHRISKTGTIVETYLKRTDQFHILVWSMKDNGSIWHGGGIPMLRIRTTKTRAACTVIHTRKGSTRVDFFRHVFALVGVAAKENGGQGEQHPKMATK